MIHRLISGAVTWRQQVPVARVSVLLFLTITCTLSVDRTACPVSATLKSLLSFLLSVTELSVLHWLCIAYKESAIDWSDTFVNQMCVYVGMYIVHFSIHSLFQTARKNKEKYNWYWYTKPTWLHYIKHVTAHLTCDYSCAQLGKDNCSFSAKVYINIVKL